MKKWSFLIIYVLFSATIAIAEDEPLIVHLDSAPEMNDLTRLYPVFIWNESYDTARGPISAFFMQVDLKNTGYEPAAMISDDPDGDGPAEAILTEPNAIFIKNKALAAVNANAFARAQNADNEPGWHPGLYVDIQGLAVGDGNVRSEINPPQNASPSRYAFWIDTHHKPLFGKPETNQNIMQGVGDWGSPLLLDGKIIPEKAEVRHPRTAVGVDQQQRFMTLVVIDGRRKDHSIGMTLYELAELLKNKGYHNAINMDGGGSSIMLYQDGKRIKTANKPSDNKPRPIPVMLGVRKVNDNPNQPVSRNP